MPVWFLDQHFIIKQELDSLRWKDTNFDEFGGYESDYGSIDGNILIEVSLRKEDISMLKILLSIIKDPSGIGPGIM
ncbi:MAG TPA: hypothetical protein DDW50_17615 [Firmicutes bacterium]|jgi:hypothetical protein|nr:hypothetical protein [Bacillota bacterium]